MLLYSVHPCNSGGSCNRSNIFGGAECPSHDEGAELLRAALAAEGLHVPVLAIEVVSDQEAQRLQFIGSPTFRVGGRDLDARPVPTGAVGLYALTCRAYRREDGRISPLPTLAWLRQMLRQALDQADPADPTKESSA